MSLLKLPNEVIGLIIQQLTPDDFETFAILCKVTYTLVQPKLPRHNKLRRNYRHFSFRRSEYMSTKSETIDIVDAPISSSLHLLHAISLDPDIASYITFANLHDDGKCYDDDDEEPDDDDADKYIEDQAITDAVRSSGSIISLIDKSPYLRAANQDASTWYSMVGETEVALMRRCIFLLTLLPNVQELCLPSSYASAIDEGGYAVMDVIQKQANNQNHTNPLQSASLANLHTFLPSEAIGYDARTSLSPLAPLLNLQSLRSFIGSGYVAYEDGYTGLPFEHRYPTTLGEGLTRLELVGTCIDGLSVTTLTRAMRNLKIFRLAFECKWHGCGYDWGGGTFVAALARTVGGTLEDLSIDMSLCDMGSMTSGVGDLRAFERLRKLELSVRVFRGPRYCAELMDGGQYHEDYGHLEEDVPRLVDALPPGLETLKLLALGNEDLSVLKRLFEGWVEERKSTLGVLKSARVRYSHQPGEWKEALDIVRLALGQGGVEFVEELQTAHADFMKELLQKYVGYLYI